jgi:anti-sigma B factor antagonist
LKIKQKAEGDVMVLFLSGKIMGGPDYERFHSEVNWINSTGLGLLVSAYTTLQKNGGTLKICEVSERIDNILNVTQLKLVFETFESCDEALASFGPPSED